MHLINIYPMGNISAEYRQSMHMYLTHMVEKYPMYAKVAKESTGYKILDNSLIELGGAVDIERVLAAAEKIDADEIILPDVFQNSNETLKAVNDALEFIDRKYKGKCPYKLMAVAQGATEAEWLGCYDTLLNNPKIDVIGIPKVLAKMHPQGRPYFVNKYCNLLNKEHHLLGVWYSLSEFTQYKHLDLIRSCDSVLICFVAKYGLNVSGVRPDGFTLDLENECINPTEIQKCINLFKEVYSINE